MMDPAPWSTHVTGAKHWGWQDPHSMPSRTPVLCWAPGAEGKLRGQAALTGACVRTPHACPPRQTPTPIPLHWPAPAPHPRLRLPVALCPSCRTAQPLPRVLVQREAARQISAGVEGWCLGSGPALASRGAVLSAAWPAPLAPPPSSCNRILQGWMEPFQEGTMFLIGDKWHFPADPAPGAMQRARRGQEPEPCVEPHRSSPPAGSSARWAEPRCQELWQPCHTW